MNPNWLMSQTDLNVYITKNYISVIIDPPSCRSIRLKFIFETQIKIY